MPKAADLLKYRLRITVSDGRALVGQLLAFDKHMNLVLGECEEYRRLRRKDAAADAPAREEKRALGLVILRGDTIVSISVEAPPPPSDDAKTRLAAAVAGGAPGVPAAMGAARAMGRGHPLTPAGGLSGPARGVGGMPPGFPMGMPPGFPMGMPPPPPGVFPPGFAPPPGFPLPPGPPPGMFPPGGLPYPPPPPPPQ